MPALSEPPGLLDRAADVESIVRRLGSVAEIAIDTEADSLHHYHEKLCLLQLGWDVGDGVVEVFLVDPLSPEVEVARLLPLLSSRRVFLHGADYDLRMLGRVGPFRPRQLFDTMIAARYLGEPEVGLAALLERRFGVVLEKTHQRADWSRRPLSSELRRYAGMDVRHLPELAHQLEVELEAKGRLAWHREACRQLAAERPEPRAADPDREWRIKGWRELSAHERGALREAWLVREGAAAASDLPPFRIASNRALVHLARRAGRVGPARAVEEWKIATDEALRSALVSALARGLEEPDSGPAPVGRGERLDAAARRRAEALKARRDQAAAELAIEASLIAPRAALERLARTPEPGAEEARHAGLLEWQAGILLGHGAGAAAGDA